METLVKNLLALAKHNFGPGATVDLYYNDLSKNPCTVKLRVIWTPEDKVKHFRAESFAQALFDAIVFVAANFDKSELKD